MRLRRRGHRFRLLRLHIHVVLIRHTRKLPVEIDISPRGNIVDDLYGAFGSLSASHGRKN